MISDRDDDLPQNPIVEELTEPIILTMSMDELLESLERDLKELKRIDYDPYYMGPRMCSKCKHQFVIKKITNICPNCKQRNSLKYNGLIKNPQEFLDKDFIKRKDELFKYYNSISELFVSEGVSDLEYSILTENITKQFNAFDELMRKESV